MNKNKYDDEKDFEQSLITEIIQLAVLFFMVLIIISLCINFSFKLFSLFS